MATTKITSNVIADDAITSDQLGGDLTMPGHVSLADNKEIRVGTGNDLVIKHSGSHTTLTNTTGNLTLAGDAVYIANAANSEYLAQFIANGAASLRFNNVEELATVSGGVYVPNKIGIGTNNPARELHISKASSGATSTSNSVLVIEDDDNTELSILGGSSSVLAINFGHSGDADDAIISYNTSSGSENMAFTVNAAERMRIDSAGKVGIGTNGAPSYQLDVRTGNNWGIVHSDGTRKVATYIDASSGNDGLYTINSMPLVLGTGGAAKLWIETNGNIGINEATPTSYYSKTLQINGSGNTSAIKMTNTSTGNENGRGMDIASDGTNFNIVNREVGAITLHTGAVGSPQLGLSVDVNGHVRMPRQSSWAGTSADMNSFSANVNTLQFNSNRFDQNGDFNTSNYTFTAPTSGRYLVCCNLYLKNMDNSAAYYQLYVETSNRVYYSIYDPQVGHDSDYWDMTWSGVVDMDESDTVIFKLNQSGGAAQSSVDGQSFASVSLLH